MKINPQGQRWCFTLNNYTPDEEQVFVAAFDDGTLKYVIYGREVAPDTGTKHLQGFLIFAERQRLVGCKALNARAHWERCKGTPSENIVYCSKGGDVLELGDPPLTRTDIGELNRSRWAEVIASARDGTVEDKYPREFIQYYSTIQKLRRPLLPQRICGPIGLWLWGPTRSGKSRRAREENPGLFVKMKNKWWDGYEHEPVVLIDDMTPDHDFMMDNLLNWVDEYPFPGEFKGGKSDFRPEKVIITSNFDIETVFQKKPQQNIDALLKRFRVEYMGLPEGASPDQVYGHVGYYGNNSRPQDSQDLFQDQDREWMRGNHVNLEGLSQTISSDLFSEPSGSQVVYEAKTLMQ